MLLASKLIGIMPISMIKTSTKEAAFRVSKMGLLIAMGLFFVTVVHTIYAPQTLINLEKSVMIELSESHKIARNITFENNRRMFKNKITYIVKIMHPMLLCMTSLSARLTGLSVVLTTTPVLLWKMNKFDQDLSLEKNFHLSNLVALLFMMTASFFFNIPIMWFNLWQLSFFETLWSGLWEGISMFNVLTTFTLELQFASFCYLVQTRFKHVNRQLLSLVSKEFAYEERPEMQGVITQLRMWVRI